MNDRLADGYEPRFDRDFDYGHQGELFAQDLIESLPRAAVEIKRDAVAARTGNLYIEYLCDKGRGYEPSGIAVTEATYWASVLDGQAAPAGLVILPTEFLRRILTTMPAPTRLVHQPRGSCPTKGLILPLQSLARLLKEHAP